MAANVLLAINSQVGGFANLEAMVNLVGKAWNGFKTLSHEANRLSQAMRHANIDISEIDSRTAQLIDTTALFTEQNKLAAAGVNATAEEYANIGAAALELARMTGEDATAAFKRLTMAISTGQTRALKQLGIDLKTSTSLQQTQADALAQLSAKYQDVTHETESFQDEMNRLDNNIGTTVSLLAGLAGDTLRGSLKPALDEINETLSDFSNFLSSDQADAKFDSYIKNVNRILFSFDGLKDSINIVAASFGNLGVLMDDGIGAFTEAVMKDSSALQKMASDMRTAADEAKELDSILSEFGPGEGEQSVFDPSEPTGKRRRKSGKGKRFDSYDMVFEEQEVTEFVAGEQEDLLANARDPSRARGEGDIAATELLLTEEQVSARAELRQKEHDDKIAKMEKEREELDKLTKSLWRHKGEVAENSKKYQLWSSAIDVTTDAARVVADVIMTGNKGIAKSIADALKKYGLAVSIENTLRAAAETAKGIAAQASTWGSPNPKSVGHFAAAGKHIATAAFGGVVAAGGGMMSTLHARGGAAPGGGFGSGVSGRTGEILSEPNGGQNNQQSVDVNIGIDRDTGDIYSYVRQRDEDERRNGRRGIGEDAA